MRDDDKRKQRRQELQRTVLILSRERTRKEAYCMAEKLQKKKYGDRLYKSYGSWRRCSSYHKR
jgi:hypothetical protein